MKKLKEITKTEDILPEYRETPIGLLLEYHNLNRKHEEYSHAEMLVGLCMDNRKHLNIPKNFSYIMRTGGANLRHYEFQISVAIGVGNIKYIALVGHTNCGMSNLDSKKGKFIQGLVNNAGWEKEKALQYFEQFSRQFEIGNEIDYTLKEVKHLRFVFPKIVIAPLFYKLNDNRIYHISE